MIQSTFGWTLHEWRDAYTQGAEADILLLDLLANIRHHAHTGVWTELASDEQLQQQLQTLASRPDALKLPLYGIPFAVKDNIDVAGFHTTAACPEYAYAPAEDAEVVRLLRAAGAIIIGKTNLDQFATGLVGTRSPYGSIANPFNAGYISGGSSSGSATAVALGYVPFALGTDTAGSGRVPAGFNHIVGLKPSKGLLSTRGVVPACRSLDCVSVFSLNSDDAQEVFEIVAQYDDTDPYARPNKPVSAVSIKRLAIPDSPSWFGDEQQQLAWESAVEDARAAGLECIETDFSAFYELAALLYQGPWVAERYASVGAFIEQERTGINPVVKAIITAGKSNITAVDAFRADYQRMALVRRIEQIMSTVDALFVPTTPRFPDIQAVNDNPVTVNSQLGTYTNFVNLADMSAIALPARQRKDGLPFGITVIAPAFYETSLLQFASRWQRLLALPTAPQQLGMRTRDTVVVAVVGAHLTGMPLNHQLTSRQAILLEQTQSAPRYQLFALANTTPPKPGLVRISDDVLASGNGQGHAIVVELWRMSTEAFGSFVAEIPRPLGIGTLELADGREVKGFICEPEAIGNAVNISEFGGWRAYIAHRNAQ